MAVSMARTFRYEELEMSTVDAYLQEHRELFVVLPPARASVLVALIEGQRGLLASRSRLRRLRFLGPMLGACVRMLISHRRLAELARVLVYFSGNATWTVDPSGHYQFRFSR